MAFTATASGHRGQTIRVASSALPDLGFPCYTRGVPEPAVLVHRDRHILTLTINRPAKRNAFNPEVLCRRDAWDMLDGDPELRVAILTGAEGTSPPAPIWINWSAQ
jgi:hypothetical protein